MADSDQNELNKLLNERLKDLIPEGSGDPSNVPYMMEDFIKMLDSVKDMTDEEKEKMKKDLIMRAIRAAQGGDGSTKFEATPKDYLVFLTMILIIVSLFGKKLYQHEYIMKFVHVNYFLLYTVTNYYTDY